MIDSSEIDFNKNLIWIDLEMTGLDPRRERIIEIATIVTAPNLEIIAEQESIVLHQDNQLLQAMDEWNTEHHHASGLIRRVRASTISEREAERATLEFLAQYSRRKTSPMCGNSICLDRAFLVRYMPELSDWFHYRMIDVSTLKELVYRWWPERAPPPKESRHRATEDINDSIEELRHYRSLFFAQANPSSSP